jgi:hypothetical protein
MFSVVKHRHGVYWTLFEHCDLVGAHQSLRRESPVAANRDNGTIIGKARRTPVSGDSVRRRGAHLLIRAFCVKEHQKGVESTAHQNGIGRQFTRVVLFSVLADAVKNAA